MHVKITGKIGKSEERKKRNKEKISLFTTNEIRNLSILKGA